MDELTFVRELGDEVGAPSPATLAAARAALMLEIEREAAQTRPVDIASRPARGERRREQDTVAPVTPLEKRPRRGARVGRALLAAAAVAAVAGASFGAVQLFGALNPDRQAAPVPTVTATPTPGPTPTPTPDPVVPTGSDFATWVVTEEGIGSFRLGMPFADAVAIAGGLEGGDTSAAGAEGGCTPVVWVTVNDVMVAAYADGGDVVTAVSAQFAGPAPQPPYPATDAGITLHSDADLIRQTYPSAVETPGTDLTDPFLTLDEDGEGGRIHFGYATQDDGDVTFAGLVSRIEVNTIDVLPYEHC